MYLQATTMAVWAPRGQTPVVQVDPGRSKIGFYATLDLRTGAELVMRSMEFNASVTSRHLQQILDAFPQRPILLLWDRAPWHKGKARAFVEAHPQFDMLYFPPGCPDLNPQQHVWKQTREAVGHLCDYRHIADLRRAFQTHLENTLFHFDWLDKYLPIAFYESVFIDHKKY